MAQTGFGGVVAINGTPINNVKSIKTPPLTLGKTEVKHLTLVGRKVQYLPTLIEQGEVEIEIVYDSVQYALLLAALGVQGGTLTITLPDTAVITVDGWVSNVGETTLDAEACQMFTIKWQTGTTVSIT